MSLQQPVKTLNPEVARKIAAGEVIDRPNAIIRELMDNAIDSGAKSITVEIAGGGIEKIRIIDDGCGMTKEDLQNCARPHATSKIATEVDLMNLSTLGFRGEALASIAAVARLSIISSGWKMRASITEDHILEQVAERKGTIVQSEGLFENFPARRQFLKRAATEALMCKNTFIEKAMARPDIAFRFIQDGEQKIDLPAGQSLKDRFISANSYKEDSVLFYELSNTSGGSTPEWAFTVVIGEPAVSRTNKKDIYIYTNGRRIQEYSLVQAVEYGGQGYFPNGTYPVAAVFIQIKADLVDFNIHPAKKEARFYDISSLHHGLSSTIKNFFLNYTRQNFLQDKPTDEAIPEADFQASIPNHNPIAGSASIERPTSTVPPAAKGESDSYQKHISYKNTTYPSSSHNERPVSDFRSKYLGLSSSTKMSSATISSTDKASFDTAALAEEALFKQNEETEIKAQVQSQKVRYIGPCLGTFLLAEKNNCLYIIDQHAVHERILFDKLMNSQNAAKSQPLLIPYKINTESKNQDKLLEKLKPSLDAIGFETVFRQNGLWEVISIPERWTGSEYDLKTLLFVKHVAPEEIIRSIAAMTACKAAVKDGYVLDDETAARLVESAFTLQDPHCPHGRPIYTVISRERLFELVKRT
ncbi:MAG: DNA mismatch repair endonuclease MutL [Treponema sp.]|nr:DNA mismatch repair endonuclease MutL [Treponema sp.]